MNKVQTFTDSVSVSMQLRDMSDSNVGSLTHQDIWGLSFGLPGLTLQSIQLTVEQRLVRLGRIVFLDAISVRPALLLREYAFEQGGFPGGRMLVSSIPSSSATIVLPRTGRLVSRTEHALAAVSLGQT